MCSENRARVADLNGCCLGMRSKDYDAAARFGGKRTDGKIRMTPVARVLHSRPSAGLAVRLIDAESVTSAEQSRACLFCGGIAEPAKTSAVEGPSPQLPDVGAVD
jgi:hypothetical protein